MSRYNPDHARLFDGVTPPPSSARAPLRRSFVVELVRFADDRARFHLDAIVVADLAPTVGDRFELELEWRDGTAGTAVVVYAVHDGGFVDVRGLGVGIADGDEPRRCRLRRYPERKQT